MFPLQRHSLALKELHRKRTFAAGIRTRQRPRWAAKKTTVLYFVVVKTTGTTPPDHWTIPLCSRVCAGATAEHKVRNDSFALIWCNLFGLPQKPASVGSNTTRGRVRVPQSGRDLNPLVVSDTAKYNNNVVSVSQRTAVRTRFFSQKHEVVLGALSLVEDIN